MEINPNPDGEISTHRSLVQRVFEATANTAGHASTVDVEKGGAVHSVDTGFIAFKLRGRV